MSGDLMSGDLKPALTIHLPIDMGLFVAIQKAFMERYPELGDRPWNEVTDSSVEGRLTLLVPE